MKTNTSMKHHRPEKRLDIIANQSVEEDIIDQLVAVGHGEEFTYLHPVYGRGGSGRREGSAIWPETNVMFIVYLEEDQALALAGRIARMKEQFPNEGIRCWLSDAGAHELI